MLHNASAIQRLLDSGHSFALYREPADTAVQLVCQKQGAARPVTTEDEGLNGFLFAPFRVSEDCPMLLIQADYVARGWEAIEQVTHDLLPAAEVPMPALPPAQGDDASVQNSPTYAARFHHLTRAIAEGRFEKLVLSHCERNTEQALYGHEAEVFLHAVEAYPNAMVSLVYTPTSGRWMGCTPELLLSREGDAWRTTALAGTRTADVLHGWDTKNVHEQDVVRRFIEDTLRGMGATVTVAAKQTLRIGPLAHLRTDFSFSFPHAQRTLPVVHALHPTPAVSGFPQREAYDFLVQEEGVGRRYFSGYLGRIEGSDYAHLYVNLRCAQIHPSCTDYYAGGGLTHLSRLDEERREIARKMDLLKRCLPL